MITISKNQRFVFIGAIVLLIGIMVLPRTVGLDNSNNTTTLKKNEGAFEMQVEKGISTTLNSEAPMQGIMMLRDVLDKDPDNVKAHYALGVLSVISMQYDKANERFRKVSDIIDLDQDAARFLAEVYVKEGKKPMVIESLNKFIALAYDEVIIKQAKELINELKNI